MPTYIGNQGNLIELIQLGEMTPTLAALALAVGSGAALTQVKARPHFWKVARDPGHFDTLDDECVEIVNEFALLNGIDTWGAVEREHMDEWPVAIKEQFRQIVCASIIKDKPLPLRWMAKRLIRSPKMIVEPDGVLFVQPAASS